MYVQLALGEIRIKVATKELAGAVDKGKVGQVAEMTTRDGHRIIPRDEIQRITWRSRKLGALIGLGIGAGGATAFATAASAGTKPVDLSRRGAIVVSGIGYGLVGAAAGAVIGVERTLYTMPTSTAQARK